MRIPPNTALVVISISSVLLGQVITLLIIVDILLRIVVIEPLNK